MDAAKHLAKAEELSASLRRLQPTGADVAATVELAHGCAHQYAAAYLFERHGEDHDKHQRVASALGKHGLGEAAQAFQRIQTLRAGRWYGGQGNGEVVKECLKLVEPLRRLANP